MLNICQTRRLKKKLPEGVWNGKKPSMHHLSVICALCQKHVPNAKRRKLDEKSTPIILGGYHETSSYKIYDTATQSMSINKHLVINEERSWDWKLGINSRKS